MRSRYACTSWRQVSFFASKAACTDGIVASITSNCWARRSPGRAASASSAKSATNTGEAERSLVRIRGTYGATV